VLAQAHPPRILVGSRRARDPVRSPRLQELQAQLFALPRHHSTAPPCRRCGLGAEGVVAVRQPDRPVRPSTVRRARLSRWPFGSSPIDLPVHVAKAGRERQSRGYAAGLASPSLVREPGSKAKARKCCKTP